MVFDSRAMRGARAVFDEHAIRATHVERANVFLNMQICGQRRDQKHETRHEQAFGVKKNVKLLCSWQLEKRMGHSRMCNDTWQM